MKFVLHTKFPAATAQKFGTHGVFVAPFGKITSSLHEAAAFRTREDAERVAQIRPHDVEWNVCRVDHA